MVDEWLAGVVGMLMGGALGVYGRKHWASVQFTASDTLARKGVAVLMNGEIVESRRTIKAPVATLLRHHGRGAPSHYVYVGRNDANEHVFQLAVD